MSKIQPDYILVVDDEKHVCDAIELSLSNTNLPKLKKAFNSTQAIKFLIEQIPRAVILDVNLSNSELDGIGILTIIKKHYPRLPTIILTGHGNIHTAREAVTLGAFSFIEKPFFPEQLILILNKALEFDTLSQENAIYKRHNPFIDKIIGKSKSLSHTVATIEQAAKQKYKSFLLLGAHGTGKKTFARRIHTICRANASFIAFQVTPESCQHELKIKLFGANEIKLQSISIFDQSEKATLFIENIELLSLEIQQILYVFLSSSMVNQQKYDITLILASTCSLEKLKYLSTQDSFYKPLIDILQTNTFNIPTLFERKDDIGDIVEYLCNDFFKLQNNHRQRATFTPKALALLSSLPWSNSNLNELQTFIHWILHTYIDKNVITDEDISCKLNSSSEISLSSLLTNPIFQKIFISPQSMKEARITFERIFLSIQFLKSGSNVKNTSDRIQMERSALHRKIKNLTLNKALLNNDNFLAYILNMNNDEPNNTSIDNSDTKEKKKITQNKTKLEDKNTMDYHEYTAPPYMK